MSLLEEIIAHGNRSPLGRQFAGKPREKRSNWITCKDGFKVSVVAGEGMYCSPRPDSYGGPTPGDYEGPYYEVEVGYPLWRPEPWSDWKKYADGIEDDERFDTVFAFVPVVMVRELIASHGGEA